MSESARSGLTALVLAGGESRRLGVTHKALVDLGGRPMLDHVLERVRGQAERILISVHQTSDELTRFGCEQVVDVVVRQRGPLTGLVSGLLRLECRGFGDWLLLCPCDAPFLSHDLAERLVGAVRETGEQVAVARYQGVLQPVFSLWHLGALPVLKEALLERGRGGLMSVLDGLSHVKVDWPERNPSPFFNVNTPEELHAACAWVDGPTAGH
jgi:molybdopterin-guanine dinucleotide biosynthesis protein A